MTSKRLTSEYGQMHNLLTSRSQSDCPQYLYNAKREIPRLYTQNQTDSILDIIDYITEECGPSPHLSSTQLLVRIGQGKYADSLIGQGTIDQLL